MSLQINLVDDILTSTFLFQQELCSDIIFVDSNPCEVEMTIVSKKDSDVNKVKKKRNFRLFSIENSFSDSNLQDIKQYFSEELNSLFLKNLKLTEDLEFFKVKKNRFFGLFTEYKLEDIKNSLLYFDWIIIGHQLSKNLLKISSESIMSDSVDTIVKITKIENLDVFLSPDMENDVILAGMNDSVTSVFLDNIVIKQDKNIYTFRLDYLFESKKIKKFVLK